MIIVPCSVVPILNMSVHDPILWWVPSVRGYNQLETDDGDSI